MAEDFQSSRKDPSSKVTMQQYRDFAIWYFSEGKNDLRFGQAFVNHFRIKQDAELFYASNDLQAQQIIFEHYIAEEY